MGDFSSYLDRLVEFSHKRLGHGLGLLKMEANLEELDSEGLNLEKINAAVDCLAVLHGAGIAYRRSHTDCSITQLQDQFTSAEVRDLLSHHLTPHLVHLARVEGALGVDHHLVAGLRSAHRELPRLLTSTRKSSESFSTVCHGSPSLSSFAFFLHSDGSVQCYLVPSSPTPPPGAFLFPASDLAHFLLTSCPALLTPQFWELTVDSYYKKLSQTVGQFGLILRHMGVSEKQFKTESERALGGQWLVVTLVLPLLKRGVRLDKGTARQLLKVATDLELQVHWKTKSRIKRMVSVSEEDEREDNDQVKSVRMTETSFHEEDEKEDKSNEEENRNCENQLLQLCQSLVIEAHG